METTLVEQSWATELEALQEEMLEPFRWEFVVSTPLRLKPEGAKFSDDPPPYFQLDFSGFRMFWINETETDFALLVVLCQGQFDEGSRDAGDRFLDRLAREYGVSVRLPCGLPCGQGAGIAQVTPKSYGGRIDSMWNHREPPANEDQVEARRLYRIAVNSDDFRPRFAGFYHVLEFVCNRQVVTLRQKKREGCREASKSLHDEKQTQWVDNELNMHSSSLELKGSAPEYFKWLRDECSHIGDKNWKDLDAGLSRVAKDARHGKALHIIEEVADRLLEQFGG